MSGHFSQFTPTFGDAHSSLIDGEFEKRSLARDADEFIRFQELGLLSGSGKPRLNVAQGYFRRAENENDLDLLEGLYVYWRDLSEYLVLRSLLVNPRTLASQWSYVAVKCSKRGNDIYRSRVKRRLDWLADGENVQFFDVTDFTPNKRVHSSAIWLTLTYNVERCSRFDAIENIGKEWNAFISALRQKYGKISVLRTWECSEKGYPHIHAILLFQEAKFSVFPHFSEKEGKLTFRIKEKDEIGSLWHSHVDVQAVSSTKKLFNYMRKYQTKTLMASDSPKGTRTMSLLWLFRKRGFSVSGDFRARISDLIRTLHNSKMVFSQSRLDGSCVDASVWEFVGVFSGQELGIHSGAWTSRLGREAIDVVLERETVFQRGGYGD
ncbi:MAG: hypothetical protein MUO31_08285 [Thermodesulfovibrionales bacterium]|nr:hypothetical protein [Thermodesulfovibrionales bacterium]